MRTPAVATPGQGSPAGFFHHFDSVQAYADALVDLAFTIPAGGLRGTVVDRAQGRPASAVTRAAVGQLSHEGPGTPQLGSEPSGSPGPVGARRTDGRGGALRRFLDEIDRQLLPQAQAFHEAWGREVRPPLDLRSYLAVQLAILSGAAVRHMSDPTVMTPERYSRAAPREHGPPQTRSATVGPWTTAWRR